MTVNYFDACVRKRSVRPTVASSERFDYEYQDGELREFIHPVRQLAQQAKRVHVVFNNNLRDQGIRGASLFTTLVRANIGSELLTGQ